MERLRAMKLHAMAARTGYSSARPSKTHFAGELAISTPPRAGGSGEVESVFEIHRDDDLLRPRLFRMLVNVNHDEFVSPVKFLVT